MVLTHWDWVLKFLAQLCPRCLPIAFGTDLLYCVQPTHGIIRKNGGLLFQAIRLPSGFSTDRAHHLQFATSSGKPQTAGLKKKDTHITDFIFHFADMQQHGRVMDGGVASGSGLVVFQFIKYLKQTEKQEGTTLCFSIYNLKYKGK